MTVMVFDIETIPDFISGRKLYGLGDDVSDIDVVTAMQAKRLQHNGTDFLPHYLQKIVAISVVVKTQNWLKIWSLGEQDSQEEEIITRFFAGIKQHTPILVSWNGQGFDLPVLHYRSLLFGVNAAKYWEMGEKDSNFKWNNYISRYHTRHIDLMDVLSSFQPKCFAPLDDISQMLGFPGKLGFKGTDVLGNFFAGKIQDVRDYCETDVLNTYLIFLRFQLVQGKLDKYQFEIECNIVKDYLQNSDKEHLRKYLAHWK